MERLYEEVIKNHLERYSQMIFLSGPRQVGKTTLAKSQEKNSSSLYYLNWDIVEDRQVIITGARSVWQYISKNELFAIKPVIIFDEIHKYKDWKIFIKGFFDLYNLRCHIIVTGSAKFDVYNKGGDSLMGRYFPYNICPLTVGEIVGSYDSRLSIQPQKEINEEDFVRLWRHGGFPEPFIKNDKNFNNRWKKLRNQQLFYQDIRDLTHIHEIAQLELVAKFLTLQVGGIVNRTELGKKVNISTATISKWLQSLEAFYYCFQIKPWTKNISRSLVKEPKIYLWDWSLVEVTGAKAENFIAVHLMKYVNLQNDLGSGEYSLHFIRDKEQNEVDFLVVKDGSPWLLVEVKYARNHSISKALYKFQKQIGAEFAFQVIIDMPYIDADCFALNSEPVIVPAKTLLSQLI